MKALRALRDRFAPNLVLDKTLLETHIADLNAEITALRYERDNLAALKEHTWNSRHINRILHHSPQRIAGDAAIVGGVEHPNDIPLVVRVALAYRSAVRTPVGSTDSMWLSTFAEGNKATHETLENSPIDEIAAMLRDPGSSMLFYGFDNLQAAEAHLRGTEERFSSLHRMTYDTLLQTARAVAARRVEYPEAGVDHDDAPPVEELLEQLDKAFGFKIDFPNPFAGEIGIRTSRGIVSYRAAQALFQAYRTRQLVGDPAKANVMEIGAGLGRTAYYALRMGIGRYTIIDIPMTNVAQGYYLSRVLGDDNVSLYGEPGKRLRVLPPVCFRELDEKFDLIVNVDSLTEMAESTAFDYVYGAQRLTRQFLSINHEHNVFTVHSLYRIIYGVKAWRSPYWLRRGYVEELLTFADQENS
jgi:hypothetical protein